MKVIRRIAYWVAAVVLVVITFWFGYLRKSGETSVETKITPVEVETVTTGSIEETIEMTGWIRANQLVHVASKAAGRVESLHFLTDNNDLVPVEEGVLVKKDRQLAVIDHDVYLAQVAAVEASVKAREVELKDAEREKKRIIGLYEGGSVPEQTKDKAVTVAELAAASLSLAKANLELAQLSLRESTIVSPIDGIVTAKHIDMGNLIRAGDRLVTVADMKTVKVVVPVAEKYVAKVAVGMPVRIRVDAYQDREFNAKVYSVHPALDDLTHTIQIEIRLDNHELLLKPGMFARVTLITKQKENVVIIPRDVILGGKIDKHYVYVIGEENYGKIAHKRIVEIGIKQGDRYEI
ncbi:MAG: efflux RND transporter periplasmic adaptor subunit, partial [Sedimentisphaerales bacterium]